MLTPDWGNTELKKPRSEQHPILRWYKKVCEFQQAQMSTRGPNGIFSAEMTGAVRAYLGLAYDLYLCAHNADFPELLVKRLRNPQTFEGALYEAYVIGNLAKAGFHIELEDETDFTRSHCELIATHQDTKRKFSVEAKAVSMKSARADQALPRPRYGESCTRRFESVPTMNELIFVELNRAQLDTSGNMPDWVRNVDDELAQSEKDLTIKGQPAPSAYVFVTNRGFMHALEDVRWTEVGLACGYKINDFASRIGAPSILHLVQARERHAELHWLRKALQTHNTIPNSFDDRLPEENTGDENMSRLLIGSTYLVADQDGKEALGILTDAVVVERSAHGTYRLKDGRHIICTSPLTDTELAAYKRSPDTFFGVVKEVSREITEPLDCYDFLWEVYSKTSPKKLLEFTVAWPNHAMLSQLNQKELARTYCARMAELMWATHVRGRAVAPSRDDNSLQCTHNSLRVPAATARSCDATPRQFSRDLPGRHA